MHAPPATGIETIVHVDAFKDLLSHCIQRKKLGKSKGCFNSTARETHASLFVREAFAARDPYPRRSSGREAALGDLSNA
jgi:hypothetical protein